MPDLTPSQSEAVRRALAAARHDEPVPAEVAARLDDVLADLVADREAGAAVAYAPARPSADHFRRHNRRVTWLLGAAAAAVVAGGFGVSALVDPGSTADTTAEAGPSTPPPALAPEPDGELLGELGTTAKDLDGRASDNLAYESLPKATVDSYTNRARRELREETVDALAGVGVDVSPTLLQGTAQDSASLSALATKGCAPTGAPGGTVARFHDRTVWITVDFGTDETADSVAIHDCGKTAVLRRIPLDQR